jgi:multicomponent Na+:H+ antiporter subunit E
MRHTLNLSLILAVFWLVNSGHYNPLMLSLAAVSVAFVVYITHKMDIVDHGFHPFRLSVKLVTYHFWLIKEIVLSNISVVKSIWLGNKTISPTLATLSVSQKTDVGKVIYANSITLTPGTVTVGIQGDQIVVHALLRESMDDLKGGEMDRRVTELER